MPPRNRPATLLNLASLKAAKKPAGSVPMLRCTWSKMGLSTCSSRFFVSLLILALLLPAPRHLPAAEPPVVTAPRQTSGDQTVQPDWEETLHVTVGNHDADIVGSDQRAIQAAVDHVARLGGGTVHIGPGTYRCRNAVYLHSGVHLIGAGEATVFIKEPSTSTKLALDSDWYDQEITLEDATGFRVGDGICLQSKDPQSASPTVVKRTLTARSGNRFRLDQALRENLWLAQDATCSTLFPLLSGERVENVRIENLLLDGNRAQHAELNGNYGGCIFLQDCNRIQIRGITARNNAGDGISWQICHDVIVENCLCEHNSGLGLHPGSGSQRPIIRRNRLRDNDIGIFFCWGVKFGLAEDNQLEGNRIGISLGHRDTDNLITANTIRDSRDCGLLFRPERGPDYAAHRNRIEGNTFVDNAPAGGAVIDIQGATEAVTLRDNRIVDTRGTRDRTAIRQGPDTRQIQLTNNALEGLE